MNYVNDDMDGNPNYVNCMNMNTSRHSSMSSSMIQLFNLVFFSLNDNLSPKCEQHKSARICECQSICC